MAEPGRRRLLATAVAGLALAACARRPGLPDAAALPATTTEPARAVAASARERRILVEGVPINVWTMGDSGPPVMLIHGASGNLRDWTFRAAPILARRYRVIAFDRPGHGRSGLPEAGGETLAVQARLMRVALARLGIERAILVGHSYGGSVALAWALDAPETVAGLLLIAAPSQVWPGGLSVSTDLLAHPLSGPVLARTLPALVPQGFLAAAADRVFAPQQAPDGYLAHLGLGLVLRPATLRINARQIAELKPQIARMAPHYPRLDMPVEIIHGAADTIVPLEIHSEPLSRAIPGARLTRLEGIGHMPHHAAFAQVKAALARLVARL